MIERVLSAIGALAVPLLGLMVQASRRNRLQRRIDEHLRLAERVKPLDPSGARELESLASEALGVLIRREQRWLRRKLDPSAIVALIFFIAPGGAGFVLALEWHSDWRWPAIVASALWTVVWLIVGATQLMTEASDDALATN
jgi:hypothetical protein